MLLDLNEIKDVNLDKIREYENELEKLRRKDLSPEILSKKKMELRRRLG